MAVSPRLAAGGLPEETAGRGSVRALAPVLAVSVAGLAAGALLYVVDPNQPGHYPTCPFLALTGLYCPGCGALRATHDLLHGDVAGALARNPLAVLGRPLPRAGVRDLGAAAYRPARPPAPPSSRPGRSGPSSPW